MVSAGGLVLLLGLPTLGCGDGGDDGDDGSVEPLTLEGVLSVAADMFDCDVGRDLLTGTKAQRFTCEDAGETVVVVWHDVRAAEGDGVPRTTEEINGCVEWISDGAITVWAYRTGRFDDQILESSGLAEELDRQVHRTDDC
jgi:hypothetical protein